MHLPPWTIIVVVFCGGGVRLMKIDCFWLCLVLLSQPAAADSHIDA